MAPPLPDVVAHAEHTAAGHQWVRAMGVEEADAEGLRPVIPLGRRAVASLTHHNPPGCGPRALRPIVAVGHDYNAQGPLDTSIGRIKWEEGARGQADKQGRVTHGPPVPARQISRAQGKNPRPDTWHDDGLSREVHCYDPHDRGTRPTLHLLQPSHSCHSMTSIARPGNRPQTDIDSAYVCGYTRPCQA